MPVLEDVRGRTLVVTIDRLEARNAVDRPAADALADAFRSFEADDDLDVAILTGAGGHFCAGADLKAMSGDPARANRVEPDGDGPMGPTRMVLRKPVLCPAGTALDTALELAATIASWPQGPLRGDRLAAIEATALAFEDAMRNEFARGVESLGAGQTLPNVRRFAQGEGRHGEGTR